MKMSSDWQIKEKISRCWLRSRSQRLAVTNDNAEPKFVCHIDNLCASVCVWGASSRQCLEFYCTFASTYVCVGVWLLTTCWTMSEIVPAHLRIVQVAVIPFVTKGGCAYVWVSEWVGTIVRWPGSSGILTFVISNEMHFNGIFAQPSPSAAASWRKLLLWDSFFEL